MLESVYFNLIRKIAWGEVKTEPERPDVRLAIGAAERLAPVNIKQIPSTPQSPPVLETVKNRDQYDYLKGLKAINGGE